MPEVVDPNPILQARLEALAAEYEPAMRALESEISRATTRDVVRLQTELRKTRRAYASARRQADKLLGPTILW